LSSQSHNALRDSEMVYVPAGHFIMGISSSQAIHISTQCRNWSTAEFQREQPQRKVWLDAYWIDKYPVTYAQYKIFIDETGRPVPNRSTPFAQPYNWDPTTREYPPRLADHPVVLIDWYEASAYAAWAGKRLPTEAEWEKAARGIDGRIWPWGDAWDERLCNHGMGRFRGTSPVSKYPGGTSPFGAADMAGNVWEWCLDGFDLSYHSATKGRNPKGQGEMKAIRGGCFFDEYPELFRCAVRDGVYASAWEVYRGFRCVRSG
jgi:formylglycine-generating enzyme